MPHIRYPFDIKRHELDTNARVPASVFIRCLQEAADYNATELGFDSGTMMGQNLLWVLLRLHIRLEGYPTGLQRIEVETWPSGTDSRLAYRDYRLYLGDAREPFGLVTSAWMLLDASTQRPVSVADRLRPGLRLDGEHAFVAPQPAVVPGGAGGGRRRFPVRLSDIDLNRHVNNLHYVEWIVESVPEDVWAKRLLQELAVEFRKQVRYGETVESVAMPGREAGSFVHRMTVEGVPGLIVQAWSRWV
jgi:acyl-ACP thioesterase